MNDPSEIDAFKAFAKTSVVCWMTELFEFGGRVLDTFATKRIEIKG